MKLSYYKLLCIPLLLASMFAFTGYAHASTNDTSSTTSAASASTVVLFQSFDQNFSSSSDFQQAASVNFVWGAANYNISAWKQYNPHAILSYYLPFDRDPAQNSLQWWQTNHPDWVLYKCDRHTPALKDNEPNIPLDFSNPAVRAWQIQSYVLPASQQGYNAIAWDNLDPDWLGACGHYTTGGQWVQQYSGAPDDANWHTNVINWMASQLQQLHTLQTPMPSIPNVDFGGWNAQGLPVLEQITDNSDQILAEQGFIGAGRFIGPTWNALMAWIQYTQSRNKMFYSSNGIANAPTQADLLWTLANYLLVNQGNLATWLSQYQAYGSPPVLYPEYQAATALQQATNQFYLSQSIYRRDFTGGLVLANADSVSHTFTVSGTKKDLYGNVVSGSITLSSGAGVVLLNA